MPTQPIPFVNMQESGDEALSGASPIAMNVVVDRKGTLRRRPGVAVYSKAPTDVVDSNGIDGIYSTVGGKLYAVGRAPFNYREIYELTAGGAMNISSANDEKMKGKLHPIFAETEALVVIAGGEEIQRIEIANGQSARLAADAPEASHVIANSSRLLANDLVTDDGQDKIRFSALADGTADFSGHEDWSFTAPAGFFSAEGRPDPVDALGESTNEVFAFGTTSMQTFGPDPAITYAPVTTREYGISAPYSLVKIDQSFGWMDHRRRFIISDGRQVQPISGPIQQDLDDMAVVNDCIGYRINTGPVDCFVWFFPTDGRTYCYQTGAGWSQWAGWDTGTNNWKSFLVTAHAHSPSDNADVVGLSSGKVGEMVMNVSDDLGEQIHARVETGFLDRGTDQRKHCKAVHVTFKREGVTGTESTVGWLSYSDEPGRWSDLIPLRLNKDSAPVVTLRSLGVYRRRAWRFEFSSEIDLVLSSVTEEFTALGV